MGWDNTVATNGIRSPAEPVRSGVRVALVAPDNTELDHTTTDALGEYSFAVAPGTYKIAVDAPFGYDLTMANAGTNDAVDSDPDPATGRTDEITVAADDVTDVDAGLVPVLSISQVRGLVWRDYTPGGVRTWDEPRVPGVGVDLFTAAHEWVATTTTDSSGEYVFENLPGGDYYVVFTPGPYDAFTAPNAGTDDAFDSDADAAGRTAVFPVVSGNYVYNVDAGLLEATAVAQTLAA